MIFLRFIQAVILTFATFLYCHSACGTSHLLHMQQYEGERSLMAVIEAVAKGIIVRHRCITIIVDTHYHRVLDLNWNMKFSYILIYMIVIEQNDGLSPLHKVDEVLRASRTTDCHAYIILNRNGLQVSRLLQYGEKERLIDSRGDFLLLHDNEIFNSTINYIWNRIVNVVFIRRYNSTVRLSGERAPLEWFDLNTVPFPYSNEGDLQPQYVDTWHRGRFRYKNYHYPDKTKNLLNQPLRIAMLPHIPAITENAKKRYEGTFVDNSAPFGIEFELMSALAKTMNFRPVVYIPANLDNQKWGTANENGSFSGLFGEAIFGNIAFLLGDLYYTTQHLELFDLSEPYNTECLTFLTPEALNDNSWKILIMPFKTYMWISILSTLFVGGLTFNWLAQCYKQVIKLYKPRPMTVKNFSKTHRVSNGDYVNSSIRTAYIFTELQNSILYTYGTLLSVSLPRLPDAWAIRVFIGWWWIYSILVTVAYRASMTAILANPMSRVTIDTLSQLASSQIPVGGWNEEVVDFFLSSSDMDFQKIGKKFEIMKNDDDAVARVASGKFAYYENKYFLRHARVKRQILEEAYMQNASIHLQTVIADRNLHIMSECVIHMPISLGLYRNSPLKRHVDLVIRRVSETGLVQKWLGDAMQWTVNAEIPRDNHSSKGLINLRKLYGVLVALAVGYFVSSVALIGEIFHWKYIVQQSPIYDKYYVDVYYKFCK